MKLFVIAKPNAKEEKVEEIDSMHFRVSVKEPPVQGRANEAIIKALASFLNIASSRLKITSGRTSKQKVIEVSSLTIKTSQ